MVAIIAGGERWHTNFLRRGARVMPPAAFSAIVVDSIALGVRFDCSVLKQSTAQLEQRDPMAAADLRRAAAGCLPVRP
jgi:hypothetical protein